MKTGNRNRMFSVPSKSSTVNDDVGIQKVINGLQQNRSKFEQLIAMLARTTKHNPVNHKYVQKISDAEKRIGQVLEATPGVETDIEYQNPRTPGQ